jgi:hypothetical protein
MSEIEKIPNYKCVIKKFWSNIMDGACCLIVIAIMLLYGYICINILNIVSTAYLSFATKIPLTIPIVTILIISTFIIVALFDAIMRCYKCVTYKDLYGVTMLSLMGSIISVILYAILNDVNANFFTTIGILLFVINAICTFTFIIIGALIIDAFCSNTNTSNPA